MIIEKNLYHIIRPTSNCIEWQEGQKELICKLYQNGTSLNQISRDFDNLHYNTIKKILIEFNIPMRTRSQSKMINNKQSNIFHNIDTYEKAYWLGYLAADGFCGREQDNLSGNNIISLVSKDEDVIAKFTKFLSSNKEYTYDKDRDVYFLKFQDKEMAIDLVNHGIYNHKSLTLQPPQISKELDYDFIRGYFDGDGGVNVYKDGHRIQMYFTGTFEMLTWIKQHFNTTANLFKEHRCKNNTWRLVMTGPNLCKENFDKMYKNSTESSRMNRKYNIFNNYFSERFNK